MHTLEMSLDMPLELPQRVPSVEQCAIASVASVAVLPITHFRISDPPHTTTCCNSLRLQTGENEHIVLQPTLLEYINHSCNPTAFFDTAERQLVALRDIQPGDEVTFNYVSTEFDMATPFDCHCGEEGCFGRISGAAHVPQAQLEKCRLNAHISRMLAARDAKV
ncbi:hypothetical protein QJQ45_028258 [Haematococcus lacustris]|nr:hypothetical protein QJQ45_028258 [Haematococcus lacustris]